MINFVGYVNGIKILPSFEMPNEVFSGKMTAKLGLAVKSKLKNADETSTAKC
jgi:hypothetical protein